MLKPGTVRFLLSLVVVFFHVTKFVFLGHFSVFCFFMLSGYWISIMYDSKYKTNKNTYASFYISRVWRLLPVFLLLNALAIVFYNYYHPELRDNFNQLTPGNKVIYWIPNLFIIGFSLLKYQVLVPAWSLDIELQFYFLFPFIFSGMRKIKNNVYPAAFCFLVFTFLLSAFYDETVVAKTLLYYVPYFLIGIIIYLKDVRFSRRTERTFTLLFLALVVINYAVPALRQLTVYNNHSDYNRFLNQCLPLLLIPFISNSVRTPSSSNLDRTLGNMSYVLYLAHWVFLIPYGYYTEALPLKAKLFATVTYFCVTIGLSYLIYQFFDRPVEALRRKWVSG